MTFCWPCHLTLVEDGKHVVTRFESWIQLQIDMMFKLTAPQWYPGEPPSVEMQKLFGGITSDGRSLVDINAMESS